jgi:hypothetical protein
VLMNSTQNYAVGRSDAPVRSDRERPAPLASI